MNNKKYFKVEDESMIACDNCFARINVINPAGVVLKCCIESLEEYRRINSRS